ncbi:hypothetical protein ARMSODRAFT_1023807 [Armillaria solidipes]|uniref:Uncharacterized protein n=1 Tax=Armillaria solidipes TaxID=1076256 RepID=A0A2H3BKL8_9AGAR|nr:hypothetical protein ARMSODRAFT_1023807 [Armillaria solidipes]
MDQPSALLTETQAPSLLKSRGCGQPRKYVNAEERAAAHNLAQQGYYERNRDNEHGRVQTHMTKRARPKRIRRPADEPPSRVKSLALVMKKAPIEPEAQITKLRKQLGRYMREKTPADYVGQLYLTAMDSTTQDPLEYLNDDLARLNGLLHRTSRLMTDIYHEEGCTERWRRTDALDREVKAVVDMVQDLVCSAMLSVDSLKAVFDEGSLTYQNL